MPKEKMTVKYAGVQGFYWAARCPVGAFAAVYLQKKGFDPGTVGAVLAMSALASAIVEPFIASAADRSKKWSLRTILTVILVLLLSFCGAGLLLKNGKGLLLAVFFVITILCHVIDPLLNAIGAYFMENGDHIDFGASRAIGSLTFGTISFVLGYTVKYWGEDSVLWISTLFNIGLLLVIYTIPKIRPRGTIRTKSEEEPVGLGQFVRRYPGYMGVLAGFLFIAVFHVMTENFLLNMMERIGGDSSHVGIALLVANLFEMAAMLLYERMRKWFSPGKWMGITAVCFVLKAFLFYIVPSVPMMYFAQTFQAVTYGLYAPSVVFFAASEISPRDMIKGQTICVAVFTLGGSLGNYLGGVLLEKAGVQAMTFTAFLFAAAGALLVLTALGFKRKNTGRHGLC